MSLDRVISADREFDEWIQQVRAGDEDAAARLVREYEPYIRRAARSRLRSEQLRRVLDSVDICQSVLASLFVRTAQGQYVLETPDQLQKLLVRMVRNKVADAWRRYSIRILGADGLDLTQTPARADDAAEAASTAELAALVRQHLSADELELFQMRDAGCEWDDISRRHGASPEALRKRLARALENAAVRAGLRDEA